MHARLQPLPRAVATARLFEDFDAPPPRAVLAARPAYDEAALTRARAEAYAEGARDAAAAAARERDESAEAALAAVATALAGAALAAREQAERHAEAVAGLLLAALRAALPALCARHGAGEVAALARAVLPLLGDEPELVIHAGPDATPALGEALARLGPAVAGRTRCAASEAILPGDARIEWRRGAAVRDTAGVLRAIDAVLAASGMATAEGAPA